MPTTLYTVFDGEIVSESRAGVLHDYVSDPLGNTIALLDNTQTQTDQWAYFPYGESVRLKGTTATPMTYVGNKSCRQDSSGARSYMLYRFLDMPNARWMTEDPKQPPVAEDNLYAYADLGPITYYDATGLDPVGGIRGKKRCLACGNSIRQSWFPSDQHKCSHRFVHCVACCVLTRVNGERCAEQLQHAQNICTLDTPSKREQRTKRRQDACQTGITIGTHWGQNYPNATCQDWCAAIYTCEPGPDDCSKCKGDLGSAWPLPKLGSSCRGYT